ncbi:MAG: hypothetical protein WCH34_07850 [Bacteroidota bacterium]
MKINLDLVKDFENAVLIDIEEFKKRDFKFLEFDVWKINKEDKDISEDKFKRDLIYTYANLRQRMIDAKPRRILYAGNFERLSDYEDGLKFLENKIIRGESLIPHLSRQIFKPNEQDGMLFDFGIYHLHLGTTPDIKKSFLIQGREKILYCLFDNEFAYFLTVDKHGRWNDLDLLRIIRDSFPKKLESWEMKDVVGLTFNPTEEERLSLLKSGINTPIELDGKFYISPGGGINSAKTSAMAVMEMNRYYHRYRKIEKFIKNHFADNIEIESKLNTDILNLSLQSFTPLVLIDIEKDITIEIVIKNDLVERLIINSNSNEA